MLYYVHSSRGFLTILQFLQLRTSNAIRCRDRRTDAGQRFIRHTLKQRLEADGQTNHVWIRTLTVKTSMNT